MDDCAVRETSANTQPSDGVRGGDEGRDDCAVCKTSAHSQTSNRGRGGDEGRDDCAIRIATWNICNGHGGGLEAAEWGLKHMNVPIAVL